MAKMTLLEMTQDILSELSSDEVNSIGDTTESLQVATFIKGKYRDIVSRTNIPEHTKPFQLVPSNDADKPVLMYLPDGANKIEWIKYLNTDQVTAGDTPLYQYVTIVPITQFLDLTNGFNTNDIEVDSFVFSDGASNDFVVNYKNNAQPSFCTIISDYYVLFDSFDSTQDNTLQNSKTMCLGQLSPVFLMEDDFVPPLDDKQFSLLFNEVKALAFYNLKQQVHHKAEQEVRRQWSSVQKNKAVKETPSSFDRLPDFGRRTGAIWRKYS